MAYRLEGECTYASNANRNTVSTNVSAEISGYFTTSVAGRWPAGVVNNADGVRLSISIEVDTEVDARDLGLGLITDLNTTIKYTSGQFYVYEVPS